jgi:O-antigen/teichoic acid export membrane protein
MDTAQWGRTIVGLGIVQIGGVVLVAALPQAITRAWFDGDAGPHRARAISGFLWVAGPVLAGAAVLVATAFPSSDSTFIVALAGIGAYAPVIGAQAILRAQNRPVAHLILTAGCSALAHLSGLIATSFVPTSLSYLTGFGISCTLALAVAFAIARPALPWAAAGAVRQALAAGLPLLPHTLALMLLIQGDPFLLKAAAGDGPAGQYGSVLVFSVAATVLLGALNNSWTTRLMSATELERPARIRRIADETGWAGLGIMAVAIVVSGPGSVALSAGETGLAGVARILPLAGIGFGLYLLGSNLLFLTGRETLLSVATPLVAGAAALAALVPAAAGDLAGVAVVKVSAFLALGLSCLWLARGSLPDGRVLGRYALSSAAVLLFAVHPGAGAAALAAVAVDCLLRRRTHDPQTSDAAQPRQLASTVK